MNDDPKIDGEPQVTPRHITGGDQRQLELALVEQQLGVRLSRVVDDLNSKRISSEVAERRVLGELQGAVMGEVSRLEAIDPEMAASVVAKLTRKLQSLVASIVPGNQPRGELAVPVTKASLVVESKTAKTLNREVALLEILGRSDQTRTLAQLLSEVQSFEPDLKGPTLTTALDRLRKANVISRPSKGHFRRNGETRAYLASLKTELANRE